MSHFHRGPKSHFWVTFSRLCISQGYFQVTILRCRPLWSAIAFRDPQTASIKGRQTGGLQTGGGIPDLSSSFVPIWSFFVLFQGAFPIFSGFFTFCLGIFPICPFPPQPMNSTYEEQSPKGPERTKVRNPRFGNPPWCFVMRCVSMSFQGLCLWLCLAFPSFGTLPWHFASHDGSQCGRVIALLHERNGKTLFVMTFLAGLPCRCTAFTGNVPQKLRETLAILACDAKYWHVARLQSEVLWGHRGWEGVWGERWGLIFFCSEPKFPPSFTYYSEMRDACVSDSHCGLACDASACNAKSLAMCVERWPTKFH